MKAKKGKKKLEARIIDYEKTIQKLDEKQRRGYRKPGSENKHKN